MMSGKSSIRKNFAYQMIYEVLVLLLPFITSPYLSRVVGAEGLGIYSYSYSVAYYFVLFSMLGLQNYGNRAIAQCRDDKDRLSRCFSDILAVHILISLISSGVYVLYILTVDNTIYAIIQGAYVISALFDISWFYFGIEKFKITVMRSSIIKIATVVLILLTVNNPNDLWKYCFIMAFGTLISQMALWLPLKQYVKIVKPEWSGMKTHVKPMAILFIPTVAISLYKYMDKIMLGGLNSKAQLGFYENAEKVVNIPTTIISSFGTVMLPKMSNLVARADKKASARYISVSMQFVMCLAMALSCGLAAVGRVFAPVFWGAEFRYSGILIIGLAATIPFISFANVIRTQYLIPNHKDREYLSSVIAGAVVNLTINGLLIPQFGAMGAVIGTIAAEVTVCFWQTFVVRHELPIMRFIKSFLFFIFAGAFMFCCVYALGNLAGASFLTLIEQILAGIFIYCVLSVLYFYFTKNEIVIDMFQKIGAKIKRQQKP